MPVKWPTGGHVETGNDNIGDVDFAMDYEGANTVSLAASWIPDVDHARVWFDETTTDLFFRSNAGIDYILGGASVGAGGEDLEATLIVGNTTEAQSIDVNSTGFISLRDGAIGDLPLRFDSSRGVYSAGTERVNIRAGDAVTEYFEMSAAVSLDPNISSNFMTFGAPGVTNGFRWQYDFTLGGAVVRNIAQPSAGNAIASFFLLPSGTQTRTFFQMRNSSSMINSGRLIFDFSGQAARLTTDAGGTGLSALTLEFGETGGSGTGGFGTLTDIEFFFSGVAEVSFQAGGSITFAGDLNHDGSNIGFFGTAPAAQVAAYTPTNVTPDRAYDADSTSLDEVADVLGTLIADLQTYGLLQ